jgi:methionyl-tRNA formyltransferase
MSKVRTLFMGTPEFACSILEQLYQEEAVEVIGLVSQPDRRVGRKQVLEMTPTKKIAVDHNTPVYQPEKLKQDYQMIMDLQPDLIITCDCKVISLLCQITAQYEITLQKSEKKSMQKTCCVSCVCQ